jgi:hypothetical protein
MQGKCTQWNEESIILHLIFIYIHIYNITGQDQMTAQGLMQFLSMQTGQPVGTVPHVQGPGGSLFLSRQQVLMNFNMLFSAVRTAEHTGQYTTAIAGKDPQAANR